MSKILVTGSSGLIGRPLRDKLRQLGHDVTGIDLLGTGIEQGDLRERSVIDRIVAGCDGIVHLAAVSRVVWAQRDPDRCWATNVGALENLLAATDAGQGSPWIVFASSREVYGHAATLPVTEDSPLRPVNVYARSKVEGERLMTSALQRGRRGAIVRFSNVYGSVLDHADRVVPAFARAAASGEPIRVDGSRNTFDFTFVDDVVDGLLALITQVDETQALLPPIHFVSGEATTLGELATLAQQIAGNTCTVQEAPPRDFDVAHFTGDPARARALLGWQAMVGIRDGLARLIADFRAAQGSTAVSPAMPELDRSVI